MGYNCWLPVKHQGNRRRSKIGPFRSYKYSLLRLFGPTKKSKKGRSPEDHPRVRKCSIPGREKVNKCPSTKKKNIPERRQRSKAQCDKRELALLTKFSKGEKVYVKPRPTNKHQPWIYVEVIGRPAPRSYLVSTAMGPAQRNHTLIREAKAEPVDSYDGRLDWFEIASLQSESGPIEEMDQPVEHKSTLPLCCSTSERRFPSRFNDFLMNRTLWSPWFNYLSDFLMEWNEHLI